MVIGGFVFSYLADRIGRRPAIIATAVAFGILTAATAAASSFEALLFMRFVNGLPLGGLIPLAWALNIEFAPRRMRSSMVTVVPSATASVASWWVRSPRLPTAFARASGAARTRTPRRPPPAARKRSTRRGSRSTRRASSAARRSCCTSDCRVARRFLPATTTRAPCARASSRLPRPCRRRRRAARARSHSQRPVHAGRARRSARRRPRARRRRHLPRLRPRAHAVGRARGRRGARRATSSPRTSTTTTGPTTIHLVPFAGTDRLDRDADGDAARSATPARSCSKSPTTATRAAMLQRTVGARTPSSGDTG